MNDALDSFGDSKIEKTSDNAMSRSTNEYSGEELFKSIFFAYGDFAKKLSMYDDMVSKIDVAPTEQHSAFLSRFDSFAENVKVNNPNYFENFKRDILSGDNSNIQNAIKYGSISIYENVAILMPELQPLMTQLENDEEIDTLIANGGEITQTDIDALSLKYKTFLEDNNIGPQTQACSWAVVCVLYFALGVHNTVGLTANIAIAAAVAVYAAVKWYGPKLTSPKKSIFSSMSNDYLKLELFVQEISDASSN